MEVFNKILFMLTLTLYIVPKKNLKSSSRPISVETFSLLASNGAVSPSDIRRAKESHTYLVGLSYMMCVRSRRRLNTRWCYNQTLYQGIKSLPPLALFLRALSLRNGSVIVEVSHVGRNLDIPYIFY